MNRNGERWTNEEDDYIVDHHKKMNSIELSKALHRTPSSIRTRCGILGISMMFHEEQRRIKNKMKKFGQREMKVVNPLIDSETLCGVDGLRALYVPLDKIAEVICHG